MKFERVGVLIVLVVAALWGGLGRAWMGPRVEAPTPAPSAAVAVTSPAPAATEARELESTDVGVLRDATPVALHGLQTGYTPERVLAVLGRPVERKSSPMGCEGWDYFLFRDIGVTKKLPPVLYVGFAPRGPRGQMCVDSVRRSDSVSQRGRYLLKRGDPERRIVQVLGPARRRFIMKCFNTYSCYVYATEAVSVSPDRSPSRGPGRPLYKHLGPYLRAFVTDGRIEAFDLDPNLKRLLFKTVPSEQLEPEH